MDPKADNLQIVHCSPAGYVARCSCCNEVQIGIGNLATHMDLESFQGFYQALKKLKDSRDKHLSPTPAGKKILMQTPVKNLLLTFTNPELNDTIDLFAQAWVVLEAKEWVANNL